MLERFKIIYALLLLVEATCIVFMLNLVYVPRVSWYPILVIPLLAMVIGGSHQVVTWVILKIEPEVMYMMAKAQSMISEVNFDADRVHVSTGYAFCYKNKDGKIAWLDVTKEEPTLDLLKSRLASMRHATKESKTYLGDAADQLPVHDVVPCELFCLGKVFEDSAQKSFFRAVDAMEEKDNEERAQRKAKLIEQIQKRDKNPIGPHPLIPLAARIQPYNGFVRLDGDQPRFLPIYPDEESAEASGPGKTVSVTVIFGWEGTKDFPAYEGISKYGAPKIGSVGADGSVGSGKE